MPKGRPRSARWVALEQAELHEVLRTLEKFAAGELHGMTAFDLVLLYGQHCAERAGELSRHAAEVRARRRIKAAGVGAS